MDDFTQMVFKRGEKRGEEKAKLDVARNLLAMGMRDTDVAKATSRKRRGFRSNKYRV